MIKFLNYWFCFKVLLITAVKTIILDEKNVLFFLLYTDCGYSLEPPH